MICWTQIILCFYPHQQIEINLEHVNIVSIGLKKILLCVKHVIMHIQKNIIILQANKKEN